MATSLSLRVISASLGKSRQRKVSVPPRLSTILAIVLWRDHQAADGDLGPEFVDEISKFGSGFPRSR